MISSAVWAQSARKDDCGSYSAYTRPAISPLCPVGVQYRGAGAPSATQMTVVSAPGVTVMR